MAPFLKRRLLAKIEPGFRLPKSLEPDFYPVAGSPHDALDTLRAAVARTRHQQMTAKHPILGKLTHDEWTQLHCRHAELHPSFATEEPHTE